MTPPRVHHLNCGTMCPLAGGLLGSGTGLARGLLVAHCMLVETERDGLVLIDTGFGTDEVEDPRRVPRGFRWLVGPTLSASETALAQVTALGFRASDVRHVVVTHLDHDHAGGLPDFPDARVHVHALEHAVAMAPRTLRERASYLRSQWAHGPRWELYREDGETWRGLPAIQPLRGLSADIALVPLHGHTRGHSGVLIKARDRWILHAGDAYLHRNMVHGGPVPVGVQVHEVATQVDGAARRGSLLALARLARSYRDVDVVCSHDPVELSRLATRATSDGQQVPVTARRGA